MLRSLTPTLSVTTKRLLPHTCSASVRLDMGSDNPLLKTYEANLSYTVAPSPDSRGLIVQVAKDAECRDNEDMEEDLNALVKPLVVEGAFRRGNADRANP